MLWNVVNPPKQLAIKDIPTPSAQNFESWDPELLFQEPLQDSQVTSSSNCCSADNFFKTSNISFSPDINVFPYFVSSPTPPFLDNYQEAQFDQSLLQSQPLVQDAVVNGLSINDTPDHFSPPMGSTMPSFSEEGCLPNSDMRLSSFLGSTNTVGPYLPSNLSSALCAENCGICSGSVYGGNKVQNRKLELEADNIGGILCSNPSPSIHYSSVLQALSNESEHVVSGGGSPTLYASEISSLEDFAFKVPAKCSIEERKDKIHRYLKKRNERNFNKKIKYACRKTLADSRPRVKGRFARNDEFNLPETQTLWQP